MTSTKPYKFADLFCGIGGFHTAITNSKCVFASEIDTHSSQNYALNYKIKPHGDITKIDAKDIPYIDLLCAGFPCQAFSKAGQQKGFSDTRGTLFYDIERILRHKKPKYILLENVSNLVTHDSGNTWKTIITVLKDIGYRLTDTPLVVNPIDIGIPQNRPRVYIPGILDPENVDTPLKISINKKEIKDPWSFLDDNVDNIYSISKEEENLLSMWDKFYQGIDEKIIGFPIWYDYFRYKGKISDLPEWKQTFIKKNRALYKNNKEFIDKWSEEHKDLINTLTKSQRKFEWQAGTQIKSVFEGFIQMRPSGVRVSKPEKFPALVAMAQIPIIGKLKRRLTPRECANIQSFPKKYKLHKNDKVAYKQLGNSVNVQVVRSIWDSLLKQNLV